MRQLDLELALQFSCIFFELFPHAILPSWGQSNLRHELTGHASTTCLPLHHIFKKLKCVRYQEPGASCWSLCSRSALPDTRFRPTRACHNTLQAGQYPCARCVHQGHSVLDVALVKTMSCLQAHLDLDFRPVATPRETAQYP